MEWRWREGLYGEEEEEEDSVWRDRGNTVWRREEESDCMEMRGWEGWTVVGEEREGDCLEKKGR